MLHVYFSEKEAEEVGLEIIRDPAGLFDMKGINDTKEVRLILKEIEQAKYLNEQYFIARFGEKLPIEFLSTGTKVAITASAVHDKIIDLRECGINARDFIFKYIDNAHVLAYAPGYGICYEDEEDDKSKEFLCNGHKLNGIIQFADYVYRDYPGEPNSCLEV